MDNPTVSESCRELEVPRQMASLNDEIREVRVVVEELRSRLASVLRVETASPDTDKDPVPAESSPLAEEIRESARTVVGLATTVREMLSRLEV